MSGHYRMARGWQDHPVFRNETFSRRDAWVWLIEEAAFKPRVVTPSGIEVHLERGQLAHSLRFMARAWKWDEAKVRRFLARLQRENMIAARTDAGVTHLTVCEYDKYQAPTNETDAPTDTAVTRQRRGGDANEKEGRKEGIKDDGEARPRVPLHEQHDHDAPPPVKDQTEAGTIVQHFHDERKRLWPSNPNPTEPPMTSLTTAKSWLAEGVQRDVATHSMTTSMERMAASNRAPPSTLGFFSRSIADAKARHETAANPLPKGTAHGKRPDPAQQSAQDAEYIDRYFGVGSDAGAEPPGDGDGGGYLDGTFRRVA